MSEEKPVALLDMDGTICDYHGALQHGLSDVFGPEQVVGNKIPSPVREKVETLIKCQHGWYRNLKPLPLGLAIYKLLREIGFQIVICSKGSRWSKNSWTEKMEWVAEHLDDDVLMNLTQVKQLVYGRVFVDDYPAHFLPWMERRPRGIVVVPDQSWNSEIKTGDRIHKVHTVDDVQKLRPVLEKAYSR